MQDTTQDTTPLDEDTDYELVEARETTTGDALPPLQDHEHCEESLRIYQALLYKIQKNEEHARQMLETHETRVASWLERVNKGPLYGLRIHRRSLEAYIRTYERQTRRIHADGTILKDGKRSLDLVNGRIRIKRGASRVIVHNEADYRQWCIDNRVEGDPQFWNEQVRVTPSLSGIRRWSTSNQGQWPTGTREEISADVVVITGND